MNLKLNGKLVCLDLSSSINYKQKKHLIELIASNGGRVSFVLNKKINYLVKDQPHEIETYKCRNAFKLNIPVLHISFIYELVNNDSISIQNFLIKNKLDEENLRKGLIPKSK